MPSKKRIMQLSGEQAKIALLKLLEDTYVTIGGEAWSKKIDEAIWFAGLSVPKRKGVRWE